jgi:hypothetical protein
MENLIKKLNELEDNNGFKSWTLDEIKQLLDIYFIISKKESHIFNLIYSHHGCDSWEDIFRDYDIKYLEDKAIGVDIAINSVIEQITRKKN